MNQQVPSLGLGDKQNPNNDHEIKEVGADTIACIQFSPQPAPGSGNQFMVAGSWDNHLRLWEIARGGIGGQVQSKPLMESAREGPVLSAAWHAEGKQIFSGDAAKAVKVWDLQSQQVQQVGVHDGPVSTMHWIPQHNLLFTGSWDRTARFWDLRQGPKEVAQLQWQAPGQLGAMTGPERIYCSDVHDRVLAVGRADSRVFAYDVQNLQQSTAPSLPPLHMPELKTGKLNYTITCVAVFKNQDPSLPCVAIGSTEGRVAIQTLPNRDKDDCFSFKCHRKESNVFAVSAISCHPLGTFSTAGSDGAFHFWDKDNRQRLHQFQASPAPITSTAFSADGNLFAYGVGYDWSKGYHYSSPQPFNRIYIHTVTPEQIQPKKSTRR
eukprot:Clim_evm128s147 gene=Clim_evmTU128s147